METDNRLNIQLAAMARALLLARGETDWTVRLICRAVEECAGLIGQGYFENTIKYDKTIDGAIYDIIEAP